MSDLEVLNNGMNVLIEKLGIIDTERFFVFINKEKMDYTKWRENLGKGKDLSQINDEAYNETIGNEKLYKKATIV